MLVVVSHWPIFRTMKVSQAHFLPPLAPICERLGFSSLQRLQFQRIHTHIPFLKSAHTYTYPYTCIYIYLPKKNKCNQHQAWLSQLYVLSMTRNPCPLERCIEHFVQQVVCVWVCWGVLLYTSILYAYTRTTNPVHKCTCFFD